MSWVWAHKPGWGLAHLIIDGPVFVPRGEDYVYTACGRNVRVDQLQAPGYGDRCKICQRREKGR